MNAIDLSWRRVFAEQLRTRARIERLAFVLGVKFNDKQPRHPAGTYEGGRWKDEDGPTPTNSRRTGGPGSITPAQGVRLAASQARADLALQRMRTIDPSWRPTPSLTAPGSVEGAIARNEAIAREASARYAAVTRPTADVLSPGGVHGGYVFRNSDPRIRTMSDQDFSRTSDALMAGARPMGEYGINGVRYERWDGGRFGLRSSTQSGPTIDVFPSRDGSRPYVRRIHRR
jgi:hypothetical protein